MIIKTKYNSLLFRVMTKNIKTTPSHSVAGKSKFVYGFNRDKKVYELRVLGVLNRWFNIVMWVDGK